MARLPYRSAEDLPAESQYLLDRPINLFRALAGNVEVLRWMHDIGAWIRHSCSFDARLRELAILQVGYLTQSAYEFTHHVAIGLSFGVTIDEVHALRAAAEGLDPELDEEVAVVLAAARQLTFGTSLEDVTWDRLVTRFGASASLDLIFVITHYVQVVRMLGALQIDVEPEYEQYLDLLEGPAPGRG